MASDSIAFLLLLLLISTARAINGPNADTQAEIQALLSIRQSLHDPLGSLAGWDASTPSAPCDWRGVGCLNQRVSELRLPNLRLGGTISPQIANLRLLQKLNLRSNELNGTFPRDLFRCTQLHSIFLQYNALSGHIPAEISNLTSLVFLSLAGNTISGVIPSILPGNLRVFDLSSNKLSGEIPSTIASGRSLQVVNLAYNALTGEIPASFGHLLGLEYLYLGYNRLNGVLPAALANCTSLVGFSVEGNNINGVVPGSLLCTGYNVPSIRILKLGFNNFTEIGVVEGCLSALEVLDVQGNQIKGEFPVFLSNISTLREIDLSENSFTGVIPNEIWNLQGLQVLKLANNSLSGSVPNELSKSRNLTVLDVEGNMLSGMIDEFVNGLINLKVLNVGMNNFSGSFGSSLHNLTSLESLSLRGNELIGDLPEGLMVLGNLSTLDLSGNKFNGTIPTSIGNLKRLMVLNLSGNGLSGSIPDSIGGLFKLNVLDLSKQNMSGTLPSNLVGLPSLQVIALQENRFSGDVPEGLSSLSGLRYLNLSFNLFSGHIPPTFGFLKSMVSLSASNNNISGFIPPVLGNCSALEVLDLRSNSLGGNIPVEFSHLSHLRMLDLGRNNLSGQIPAEISNCSSLTSLFLDSNHLIGEIPSNLTLLPHLINLNVSHNDLEGEIPRALGSKFNDKSSFEGNRDLCGKPLNSKCSDDGNAKNRLIMFIAIAASGILLLLSCCCFYMYTFLKWREKVRKSSTPEKKQSPSRSSIRTSGGGRGSSENGAPKLIMFNDRITLAETIEATRQFEEENVLGRTRHGVVFKACYNDGMVLAILRLPNRSLDVNTFRKEAESLGRVKHRNLTVLRGYYAGPPDTRFLVYDYMPNGNLATLLQEASHQDGHVLNWPMRHLIALGIARGLAFLHVSSMVHGDVKPQNVLFDADFEAHLSDFGLDKFTRRASSEPSTSPSAGYTSPEAVLTHQVTRESDVYSFGIVLLELLTGKKPVMFTQDEDIVKWVKRQLQIGQVTELLEPGLLELDPESSEWEEFLLGIKVGLLCTAPDPVDRPAMADIVFMLEGCRVGPDVSSSADPTTLHSPA